MLEVTGTNHVCMALPNSTTYHLLDSQASLHTGATLRDNCVPSGWVSLRVAVRLAFYLADKLFKETAANSTSTMIAKNPLQTVAHALHRVLYK